MEGMTEHRLASSAPQAPSMAWILSLLTENGSQTNLPKDAGVIQHSWFFRHPMPRLKTAMCSLLEPRMGGDLDTCREELDPMPLVDWDGTQYAQF